MSLLINAILHSQLTNWLENAIQQSKDQWWCWRGIWVQTKMGYTMLAISFKLQKDNQCTQISARNLIKTDTMSRQVHSRLSRALQTFPWVSDRVWAMTCESFQWKCASTAPFRTYVSLPLTSSDQQIPGGLSITKRQTGPPWNPLPFGRESLSSICSSVSAAQGHGNLSTQITADLNPKLRTESATDLRKSLQDVLADFYSNHPPTYFPLRFATGQIPCCALINTGPRWQHEKRMESSTECRGSQLDPADMIHWSSGLVSG